jgi:undecaprenyl-diphosphatase
MPLPSSGLRLAQALALGALHGPAELIPVSSSGHVALVPWLLRWSYADLDGDLRKSFEVALHAGTAAALLIALRGEMRGALRVHELSLVVVASIPPAAVGYLLEGPIERRLGTPATVAAGLAIGGLGMALADREPQLRGRSDAGLGDAVWLGVAQACALIPGVSRSGATLTAARLRRFTRADSHRLSRLLALPVISGAAMLRTIGLYRSGLAPGAGPPVAAGAAASFLSTLACARVIARAQGNRSLLPYALYRLALATTVLRRLSTSAARAV